MLKYFPNSNNNIRIHIQVHSTLQDLSNNASQPASGTYIKISNTISRTSFGITLNIS
ncbi:hypothetical protein B7P43_G00382 [Cryptotermes secundus]|uniref:Uncharacterized protein n=1 Tax=Cryptotermes secundus TaxID=105785 RepID=A0A2J7R8I8_9NEOP|nr:hypothetical protein B7P43_G00382 [Cryptotermes secundus]